jgi:hypothetical protein
LVELKHRIHAPAAPTIERRRRPLLVWTMVLVVSCLVLSVRCAVPQTSNAAAQATAVVFGRVLSGPGMASPMGVPQPTGVAGMKITISDFASGKTISTATSGSDGSYRFTVPPGAYSVKGPGNPHSFHVDAGQQLQVDLYILNP